MTVIPSTFDVDGNYSHQILIIERGTLFPRHLMLKLQIRQFSGPFDLPFILARQRFIGIIISVSMSQIGLGESFPKRTRPRNKPTLYCLFSSVKSLTSFEKYQRKTCKTNNLRKTEESSHSDKSAGASVISEFQQLGLTNIPMVKKTYHCRKCFKELEDSEEGDGICIECVKLDRIVASGHFQKFVCYLVEFKTGVRGSYQQESKLRRIESIESIQSFTLDRGHDSQMRPNFHNAKPTTQMLHSVENIMALSKRSDLIQSGGGYFCNGCSVEPIVGRRFHCLSCEDYDLCEKCYFYMGHKHEMKSFRDQPEDIANRARLVAIKRSQSLKNTLPFLSSSIRDFEKVSNLFRTTALRHV